jgi:hypothetical protein
MIESTVNYVIKCMKFAEDRDIAHLDPDSQVVQKYNARLQRDMKKMVFSGGCDSWYTDDDDVNFTLWPYSATRFLFEQNRVVPTDFKTS